MRKIIKKVNTIILFILTSVSFGLYAQTSVQIMPNISQICSDSCITFICDVSSAMAEIDSEDIRYEWSTGDTIIDPVICINSDTVISVEAFNKLNTSSFGKDSITITFVAKPDFTDFPKTRNICVDSCTTLDAPIGINYKWYANSLILASSTNASLIACPDVATEYIVGYTFSQCPFSDTFQVNIVDTCVQMNPTDTNNTNLSNLISNNIQLYPSPVREGLHINLNRIGVEVDIEIIDLKGRVFVKEKSLNGSNEINLKDLPVGIYLINILSDKYNYSYKIVKE